MSNELKPNKHGATLACSEDFSRWQWESDEIINLDAVCEHAAKAVIDQIAKDAEFDLWDEDGAIFHVVTAFDFQLVIQAPFAQAVDNYLALHICGDGFADKEDVQPLLDALDAARAKVAGKIRPDDQA